METNKYCKALFAATSSILLVNRFDNHANSRGRSGF